MPHMHNRDQAVVTEMVCAEINVPASKLVDVACSILGTVDVGGNAKPKSHERPRDTGSR